MSLNGMERPKGCSQWNLYGELLCQGIFQSFHNLVSLLQGGWNEDKQRATGTLSSLMSIPRGACPARAIALAYLYAVGHETRTMMQ